jgi:hypothetical protein
MKTTNQMIRKTLIMTASLGLTMSGCTSEQANRFIYGMAAMGQAADAVAYAAPRSTEDSGGFLKPGYRLQTLPDGNLGVYDSQGYRGQVNGNGWFDNQGEGYTAWFMTPASKHHHKRKS